MAPAGPQIVRAKKQSRSVMQKLARRIADELKIAKHCAVYQNELSRVWPHDGKRREDQITAFAEEHGWRLRFYREGLCAIFDKQPRGRRR